MKIVKRPFLVQSSTDNSLVSSTPASPLSPLSSVQIVFSTQQIIIIIIMFKIKSQLGKTLMMNSAKEPLAWNEKNIWFSGVGQEQIKIKQGLQ